MGPAKYWSAYCSSLAGDIQLLPARLNLLVRPEGFGVFDAIVRIGRLMSATRFIVAQLRIFDPPKPSSLKGKINNDLLIIAWSFTGTTRGREVGFTLATRRRARNATAAPDFLY